MNEQRMIEKVLAAGLSVSRVGGDAQTKAVKSVSGHLKLGLSQFRELASFAQFGSDLDEATQAKLNRGRRTVEVLKQPLHKPLAVEKQVLILYALTHGHLDDVPVDDVLDFETKMFDFFDANYAELLNVITETKDLPEEAKLDEAIKAFKNTTNY